jgi:hypothetical protein
MATTSPNMDVKVGGKAEKRRDIQTIPGEETCR